MDDVKIIIEAAQRLANVSEQPVAIYIDKVSNKVEYDVAGAVQDYSHILEIIRPSLADKRIQ